MSLKLAGKDTLRYSLPMAVEDQEERLFQEDVKAVKQWWSDSRWRYTKRPFTAEQIVAKRGNLKIQYPSNDQSKKLWQIFEGRYKVTFQAQVMVLIEAYSCSLERRCQYYIRLLGTYNAYANGQIP